MLIVCRNSLTINMTFAKLKPQSTGRNRARKKTHVYFSCQNFISGHEDYGIFRSPFFASKNRKEDQIEDKEITKKRTKEGEKCLKTGRPKRKI